MTRLYTPEGLSRVRKTASRLWAGAAALAAAVLAGCILLCTGVRTSNADSRQIAVILLSALGSFTVCCLITEGALPARWEAQHEAGILPEASRVTEGRLISEGKPFSIPKSITFCPLKAETEDGTVDLRVNRRFRKQLPPFGTPVRLETVRNYIVAWEVVSDA